MASRTIEYKEGPRCHGCGSILADSGLTRPEGLYVCFSETCSRRSLLATGGYYGCKDCKFGFRASNTAYKCCPGCGKELAKIAEQEHKESWL